MKKFRDLKFDTRFLGRDVAYLTFDNNRNIEVSRYKIRGTGKYVYTFEPEATDEENRYALLKIMKKKQVKVELKRRQS